MNLQKLLFPFALIYGTVAAIRRWLYRQGILSAYLPPVMTIGVGNLSVGGTGKTPHVEYLIRLLSAQHQIATLSRGYKRKTKGFVLANELTQSSLSAEAIGDEPLQFYTKFPHVKVAVDEKRKEGIEQLLQRFPDMEYIILDDCYQHLQVKPQLSILITEYQHPYAKDYPLPAGRLREFRSAARYADIVIVSKCPAEMTEGQAEEMKKMLKLQAHQQLFFTTMQHSDLQAVNEYAKKLLRDDTNESGKQEQRSDLNQPEGQQQPVEDLEVVVLTAIAHPEPMLEYLLKKYKIIHHYRFPDHHYFSTEEVEEIKRNYFSEESKNRILITTEKDSMRLIYNDISKILEDVPLVVQPIEPQFLFQGEKRFFQILSQNSRNSLNFAH